MCRLWKLGRRKQHCSLMTEFDVLRSFDKYRALYIHLACKDVDLFPKGSCEITTEPIAVLTKIGSQ